MKNSLQDEVRYLKGVGPERAKLLNGLGIEVTSDLLNYAPSRYEDRSNFRKIGGVKEGEHVTIEGEVKASGLRRARAGMEFVTVAFTDGTGTIYGVWFNQPYMKDLFKIGQTVILSGKVTKYKKLQLQNPEYEIVLDEQYDLINTGRIVPIYPLTEGISQRVIRRIVKNCLDSYLDLIEDPVSESVKSRRSLMDLKDAYYNLHFPESVQKAKDALNCLAFYELLLLELFILGRRKSEAKKAGGGSHNIEGRLIADFIKSLPFKLTQSQLKALMTIKRDMANSGRMNRLLQGDVGCGKTVVAACAVLIAVQSGRQAAFMAPTEILAEQHYKALKNLLGKPGVKTCLVKGAMKESDKKKVLRDISSGSANLIVGTHALIQEAVTYKSLSLCIIDEQHKFGVVQREKLIKKGVFPDTLVMTATPIPRTLAITVYGDMDVSVIDEMPAGRIPVKTYAVKSGKLRSAYNFIKKQVSLGGQAYIIYPLVEESEKLSLKSAAKMYKELSQGCFKELKTGMIHGRIDAQEKERIMDLFNKNITKILISTSVIEVGIDNPRATVMLIEHAERFGLSQLHQLRGRVGRGKMQSYCILCSDSDSEESVKRAKAMVKTNDGFKLADLDLKMRGPGEFSGTRQHGVSDLRIADIVRDKSILRLARSDAKLILKQNKDEYKKLIEAAEGRFSEGNKRDS
ncbi:MAG: ATP-dependent DNA helicase RecG [Candidatus Aureabacteria bacterium]|nr:ATP-dependent DNA helicase RecG [Candidatus Auribacterota bacterium]